MDHPPPSGHAHGYYPTQYQQHRPSPPPGQPYYYDQSPQQPPRIRSPSVSSGDSQSSYATTSSLNHLAADLSLTSNASSCSPSNNVPPIPPALVGEYIPPPQAGIHAPPKKKSHSKPKPEGHVPRPRNAFILFRTDVHTRNLIKNENKHGKISQIVADMWKNCTPEEKAPYQRAFEREKAEHKRLYPNYDYQPKNKKGPDGKPVAPDKPPKRQAGSKAALKAQAAQAAMEKKEAEKEEKQRKLEMGEWDSDEEQERSGSGSDDHEYVSSSSASNKRSRNANSRGQSPPNKKSSHGSSSNNTSAEYDSPQGWESSENRYSHQPPYPYHFYPYPPPRHGYYQHPPPLHLRHSSGAPLGPIENGRDGWHAQQHHSQHYFQQHYQPPHLAYPHHRYPSEHEIASMRAEQGFVVGMPASPDGCSPQEQRPPPPHHYPAQPYYPQQHPSQNSETSYSTYHDYRLPAQLAPSPSTSTSPTESQDSSRPTTSQSHQILSPSYIPPQNHFLTTAAPSPLTPGFPAHLQAQQAHQGSSASSLRKDTTVLESIPDMPPFTPGFQSFLESYTNPHGPIGHPVPVGPPPSVDLSSVPLDRSRHCTSSSSSSSSSTSSRKEGKELSNLFTRAPLHSKSESSSPESIESSHSGTTETSNKTSRGPLPARPPRPAHADWNLAGQPIFVPPPPSNQSYPPPGDHPPQSYYPPHPDQHHYQPSPYPAEPHHQQTQLPISAPSSLSTRRRGKTPPQPLSFPSAPPASASGTAPGSIPTPRTISFGQNAHLRAGSSSYHLSSERTPTQASFYQQHQEGQPAPSQPQYGGQVPGHEMSMGEVERGIPSDWVPMYEGPEWGQ